ncbi:hypothetical protein HYDPIDRAFT_51253, partial [Hydnomerulius pinastri MD-312]
KLVAGSYDDSVCMWTWDTGELLVEPMKGHEDIVGSVVWTVRNEELISASQDFTIHRWNATTGEAVGEPLRAHDGAIYSLALSSDGKIPASASADETVKLWNVSTFKELHCFTHEGMVYHVVFPPNDKQLASACYD